MSCLVQDGVHWPLLRKLQQSIVVLWYCRRTLTTPTNNLLNNASSFATCPQIVWNPFIPDLIEMVTGMRRFSCTSSRSGAQRDCAYDAATMADWAALAAGKPSIVSAGQFYAEYHSHQLSHLVRIRKVLASVRISSSIRTKPHKYLTTIYCFACTLSGGQVATVCVPHG